VDQLSLPKIMVEKFIKSFDLGHFSGEKPVNSLFFPSKEALILTAIINWHTSSHSFKVRLNLLSFMLIGKSQLFLERGKETIVQRGNWTLKASRAIFNTVGG